MRLDPLVDMDTKEPTKDLAGGGMEDLPGWDGWF